MDSGESSGSEVSAPRSRTSDACQADHEDDEQSDDAAEPPAPDLESQQRCRQLHHDEAEARACFHEGQRLARHRDQLLARGASQPAGSGQEVVPFTQKELEVLQQWDSGQLLEEWNQVSGQLLEEWNQAI